MVLFSNVVSNIRNDRRCLLDIYNYIVKHLKQKPFIKL